MCASKDVAECMAFNAVALDELLMAYALMHEE